MTESNHFPILYKMTILEVYCYYNQPVLYSGKLDNRIYIVNYVASDDSKDTWLVVEISPERLKDFEDSRITIRDTYIESENGYVWKVLELKPSYKEVHCRFKSKDCNLMKYLPDTGVYLNELERTDKELVIPET